MNPCPLLLVHRTFGEALVAVHIDRSSTCSALLDSFRLGESVPRMVVHADSVLGPASTPVWVETDSFTYTAHDEKSTAALRQMLITSSGEAINVAGQREGSSNGRAVACHVEFHGDGVGRIVLLPVANLSSVQSPRGVKLREQMDEHFRMRTPDSASHVSPSNRISQDKARGVVVSGLVDLFRAQSGAPDLAVVHALMVLAVVMCGPDTQPRVSANHTLSISLDRVNRLVSLRLDTSPSGWTNAYLQLLLQLEPDSHHSQLSCDRVAMFWASVSAIADSALLMYRDTLSFPEQTVRRLAAVSAAQSSQVLVAADSMLPVRHCKQEDLDLVVATSLVQPNLFHERVAIPVSVLLSMPVKEDTVLPTDNLVKSCFATLFSSPLPMRLVVGADLEVVSTGLDSLKSCLACHVEELLVDSEQRIARLLLGAWVDRGRPSAFQALFEHDPLTCYPVCAKRIPVVPEFGYLLAYSGNLADHETEVPDTLLRMLGRVQQMMK